MLNLLWVLWQKSGADPKLEEEQMRDEEKSSKDLNLEEEKLRKDLDLKEEKVSKDLEKLEKTDETAATAWKT